MGLHYRRDFTLGEDATRMTTGDMSKVIASINNLVLALIQRAAFHNAAQARRWFAAHLPLRLPCSQPLFLHFENAMVRVVLLIVSEGEKAYNLYIVYYTEQFRITTWRTL